MDIEWPEDERVPSKLKIHKWMIPHYSTLEFDNMAIGAVAFSATKRVFVVYAKAQNGTVVRASTSFLGAYSVKFFVESGNVLVNDVLTFLNELEKERFKSYIGNLVRCARFRKDGFYKSVIPVGNRDSGIVPCDGLANTKSIRESDDVADDGNGNDFSVAMPKFDKNDCLIATVCIIANDINPAYSNLIYSQCKMNELGGKYLTSFDDLIGFCADFSIDCLMSFERFDDLSLHKTEVNDLFELFRSVGEMFECDYIVCVPVSLYGDVHHCIVINCATGRGADNVNTTWTFLNRHYLDWFAGAHESEEFKRYDAGKRHFVTKLTNCYSVKIRDTCSKCEK